MGEEWNETDCLRRSISEDKGHQGGNTSEVKTNGWHTAMPPERHNRSPSSD